MSALVPLPRLAAVGGEAAPEGGLAAICCWSVCCCWESCSFCCCSLVMLNWAVDSVVLTIRLTTITKELTSLVSSIGPASAAQTLYRETAESRQKCEKVAAERRAMRQFEVLPEGRVA